MGDIDPYNVTNVVVFQGRSASAKHHLEGFADVFIYLDRPLNPIEMASFYHKFDSLSNDEFAMRNADFNGDKLTFETKSADVAKQFVAYVRTSAQKLADEAEEALERSDKWLKNLERSLTN